MQKEINVVVGENITRLRNSAGLNIDALAEKTGITNFRIAMIESGRVRASADELYVLKEALGCAVKDFYRVD